MADSPEKNAEGVVRLTVYCNGSKLQDSVEIESVTIDKAVNLIPVARLVVLDGDMPNKDFPVSNAADFKPGSTIKVSAGYKDQEETLFEGVVVKHNMKITGENYARLLIECRDKAVAMTVGRKNANFVDSKDSEVFVSLVGGYNGLSVTASSTNTTHRELVQYYCTDWDFLLSRAEVNGAVVIVNDSEVKIGPPEASGTEVLTVTYGQDLMEFHAEMDARYQYSKVTSVSWDPAQQSIVSQSSAPAALNAQGNLQSSSLAEVLGLSEFKLQTPVVLDNTELTDWASGQQLKSGLSRITGRMKFQGSAKALPGKLIGLAGVGERFSGKVYVSAVHHDISDGNWLTTVDFGMSPDWFADKRDLTAPPASGLTPGVEGLQIGVVMQLNDDPASENRVKVKIPVLEADNEGIWARLGNYYASNGCGEFFIPEVGDEVILGYLNNDPGHPIILGSLYSSSRTPPYQLTADNYTKAIVTKGQLKIEFDDEKKVITVITPAGNKIVISDDQKSILIQDQSSNKVELGTSGISLSSPKDISLQADGKISLDATGQISISSAADVKSSGMNIEHSADVGITAKGGASAELSAGGNTTVKGAMVMIN